MPAVLPVAAAPTDETAKRIALLVAVFTSFGAYHLLNVPRESLHLMATAFDRSLPLIPAFSVPYLLYFPYLFFTAGDGILRSAEWKRVGLSILLVQLIACAIYAAFQSYVPRPDVTGTDIFSTLLRFIYSSDRPYNTFPSLHTAHSVVSLYWWRRLYPRWFGAATALTALILLATVFLKQHVVVDVASGIVLAAAGIAISERVFPKKEKAAPAKSGAAISGT